MGLFRGVFYQGGHVCEVETEHSGVLKLTQKLSKKKKRKKGEVLH